MQINLTEYFRDIGLWLLVFSCELLVVRDREKIREIKTNRDKGEIAM